MFVVDVGYGSPVLFLHGNPTSGYLYRHLVAGLRDRHRCVAPDYLGFGRSPKPPGADYRPQAHAARVEAMVRRKGLTGLTLVMHDWGGPIGLDLALRLPERIRRLVFFNTWGWPHDRDPWIGAFSRLVGGPVGRMLIRRYNAFARWIIPLAVHDRAALDPGALRAYADPLDTPARREPSWVFPRALLSETRWLRALWAERHRLTGRPVLLVWGLRDLAFGAERYLRRWTTLFPNATVSRQAEVGHYVPEEMGPALVPIVRTWLEASDP